jgi:phage FluMu protein Com
MMASSTVLASVTVTITAYVVVYTDVRCPNCNRRVMSLPGVPLLDVRAHRAESDRLGRGAVVRCERCKSLVEAIPHAA